MKVFGVDLNQVKDTLSKFGDLKMIRDSVADLKISDQTLEEVKYLDSYAFFNSLAYNQAIDDVLQLIDNVISGGDIGV